MNTGFSRPWFNSLVRLFARTGRLQLDTAAATAREELKPILASALRAYPEVPDLRPSAQLYVHWRLRHGGALQQHGDVPLAGLLRAADFVVLELRNELQLPEVPEVRSFVSDKPQWFCEHCLDDGCNNCVTSIEEDAVFRPFMRGGRR